MVPKTLIFLFSFICSLSSLQVSSQRVHVGHVQHGYPQDPRNLEKEIFRFMAFARSHLRISMHSDSRVTAVISPHASMSYDGICKASVFSTICSSISGNGCVRDTKIKRVIVVGPSHYVAVDGVALPDFDIYRMPYGDLDVDRYAIETLSRHRLFRVFAPAFSPEHSIEVELPWISATVEDFLLVPLMVNSNIMRISKADRVEIAEALKEIIDDATLVVISSDFTHYGAHFNFVPFTTDPFFHVRRMDADAIEAIIKISDREFEASLDATHATICGQNPILLLLELLNMQALGHVTGHVTSYYMSPVMLRPYVSRQDLVAPLTDEEMSHSVSYVGIAFVGSSPEPGFEPAVFRPASTDIWNSGVGPPEIPPLGTDADISGFERLSLLAFARDVIRASLVGTARSLDPRTLAPILTPPLLARRGVFVTLRTRGGDLRGCQGISYPHYPLLQAVVVSATESARDSRFTPVTLEELRNLLIEISILSLPKPVDDKDSIVLHKHGIILNVTDSSSPRSLPRSALFLPSVPTEQGWDLNTTIRQLAIKAGLPHHICDSNPSCRFSIFEVVMFSE